MYQTFKNFQEMLANLSIPVDLDEAVDLYRDYGDVYSIAIIYVNQYGHLKNITDKFPRLTSEDKSSFILEEIVQALNNYDETKGAKIQTVVSTYVYRRCYAENKMREHQKRMLDYDTTLNSSYESYVEANIDKGMNDFYHCEFTNYLESLDLTENELKYCKIVSSGEHSIKDSDVARMMGVTPAAINYIRKKLSSKIQFDFAYGGEVIA